MSTSADVDVTTERGVREIRFARPQKKNAITIAMYGVLAQALETANADASVRAVVVTAAGETFSAGNDIVDFASAGPSFDGAPQTRLLEAFVALDKPLVAAVHGSAIGIGATMLLHCDLVYASSTAKLRMPFVSLGLVPEAASSLLLPRRVGHAVAAEMLLLGAWVDAHRAKSLGLVNDVVDGSAGGVAVTALAREKALELAKAPPRSLRATRRLLRGDPSDVRARMLEEGRKFAEAVTSSEAREAFTAFFEKRAPNFEGLG
ncbi:MAG: enoyl-CoA hydratase [Polyangiaceae bacterium]